MALRHYARRDSNPQPSVPKTDALSSCATDARLYTLNGEKLDIFKGLELEHH